MAFTTPLQQVLAYLKQGHKVIPSQLPSAGVAPLPTAINPQQLPQLSVAPMPAGAPPINLLKG